MTKNELEAAIDSYVVTRTLEVGVHEAMKEAGEVLARIRLMHGACPPVSQSWRIKNYLTDRGKQV